jgi:hypothetical protein
VLKRGAWVVLVLCGLAVQLARADTVLVSSTSLVIGNQSSVYSFQAPGAGTVVAQVTNVDWPQLLSSLSFTAGSANQVMSSWSDPGSQPSATLSFDVSGPGMYFADILATAGGPLDLGVYSLSIKFLPAAPVPLPAPAWLLLAGLAALLAWWRAASRRPAIAAGLGVPARQGA